MADTKISALSAGTALAGTEEIPGVQSATTVKFTPAQIRTYVQANMTAAVIASGTITSDANALSVTQTWNNSGVTFSGALKVDVTNTASASGSKLFDFLVGGTSWLSLQMINPLFEADPTIVGTGANRAYVSLSSAGGARLGYNTAYSYSATTNAFAVRNSSNRVFQGNNTKLAYASNYLFGFSTSTDADNSSMDIGFARNAAGVVEVNSGTAGTLRDLYARNVRLNGTTVASLVAASTAGAGAMAYVTDANATTARTTVAGGGANKVMVFSDGTNWLIMA